MRSSYFILIFLAHTTLGQDSLKQIDLVPKSVVKFSPLHLLNFYPTIQIAYEQGITKKITTQLDFGYVVNYKNNIDDRFENKRGLKMKLEPRIYFAESQRRRIVFYTAIEFYFNRINFDRADEREECFDGSCDHRFIRKYFYEVKYRERGGSVKLGLVKYYGRVVFDINGGWTMRFIRYDHGPNFTTPFQDWFATVNERDRRVPSPNIGIRLGYRFK